MAAGGAALKLVERLFLLKPYGVRRVWLNGARTAELRLRQRQITMDNYQNPTAGKTYISPSLPDFNEPSRKIRIATKLIEHPNSYAFANLKGELVLRHHADAQTSSRTTGESLS